MHFQCDFLCELALICCGPVRVISMAQCKKNVTPLLTHWSYVFLVLTHRYGVIGAFLLYMYLVSLRCKLNLVIVHAARCRPADSWKVLSFLQWQYQVIGISAVMYGFMLQYMLAVQQNYHMTRNMWNPKRNKLSPDWGLMMSTFSVLPNHPSTHPRRVKSCVGRVKNSVII